MSDSYRGHQVSAIPQEREVGIDHLTMLNISPPELVNVAREAGFDSVGLRAWLPQLRTNSPGP